MSIDLIIRDDSGKVLFGLRKNAPAQDYYFVPGGRIRKNETFEQAIQRISLTELGVALSMKDVESVGCYEQFYSDNFFDAPNVGTHYVATVFQLRNPWQTVPNLEGQHSSHCFLDLEDISRHPLVHPYCKKYFQLPLKNESAESPLVPPTHLA